MNNLKTLTIVLFAGLLVLALPVPALAQTALTSTTLSAAVTDTSSDVVRIASGTNVAAGSGLFVDKELMTVIGPAVTGSTTIWRVARNGYTSTHANAATVYVAAAGLMARTAFRTYTPAGTCTATNEPYLPIINTLTGQRFDCVSSAWVRVGGGDQIVGFCGATTGTTTCSNTTTANAHFIGGLATLASGTAVLSGISPAFTSTSTFACVGNDTTTSANVVKVVNTSTTSITFTGTGSDVISWSCVGY